MVEINYSEIGDHFNETRKKYLWPELLSLAEKVKDGDSVLDAGCGNGRLIKAFGKKKIKYLGIDASQTLISKAEEEFGKENLEFKQANILEMNKFKEINFDFVFCIAVLHHLPGEDLRIQALKQLKNKIKSDGEIIITVWNLWNNPKYRKKIVRTEFLKFFCRFKNILTKVFKRKKDSIHPKFLETSGDFGDIFFDWKNQQGQAVSKRYYHAFTKKELKRIIKKAGLKTQCIKKDKYNYSLIASKNY